MELILRSPCNSTNSWKKALFSLPLCRVIDGYVYSSSKIDIFSVFLTQGCLFSDKVFNFNVNMLYFHSKKIETVSVPYAKCTFRPDNVIVHPYCRICEAIIASSKNTPKKVKNLVNPSHHQITMVRLKNNLTHLLQRLQLINENVNLIQNQSDERGRNTTLCFLMEIYIIK